MIKPILLSEGKAKKKKKNKEKPSPGLLVSRSQLAEVTVLEGTGMGDGGRGAVFSPRL